MFSTLARTVRRRSRYFSIDSARPNVGHASLEPEASDSSKTTPQHQLGLQNDSIAACHRDSTGAGVKQLLTMETVEIPFDRSISNENTNMEKSKDSRGKIKASNAFVKDALFTLERDIKKLNDRLDGIDATYDAIDADFDAIDADFDALGPRLDDQSKRLAKLQAFNFELNRDRELDELGAFIAKYDNFRVLKLGGDVRTDANTDDDLDDVDPSLVAISGRCSGHPMYNYTKLRAIIDAITLDEFPDFPETKACCFEALEEFEREATSDQKYPWRFYD